MSKHHDDTVASVQVRVQKGGIHGRVGHKICIRVAVMDAPDFNRIAAIIKELEDMCLRAKDLREELETARAQGQLWPRSQDVKKHSNPSDTLAEAADTKANLNQ